MEDAQVLLDDHIVKSQVRGQDWGAGVGRAVWVFKCVCASAQAARPPPKRPFAPSETFSPPPLASSQAMTSSPFAAPFLDRLLPWEKKLVRFQASGRARTPTLCTTQNQQRSRAVAWVRCCSLQLQAVLRFEGGRAPTECTAPACP